MKIDLILSLLVLICAIIALIFKMDIGQSYLLPIWIIIAIIYSNNSK